MLFLDHPPFVFFVVDRLVKDVQDSQALFDRPAEVRVHVFLLLLLLLPVVVVDDDDPSHRAFRQRRRRLEFVGRESKRGERLDGPKDGRDVREGFRGVDARVHAFRRFGRFVDDAVDGVERRV